MILSFHIEYRTSWGEEVRVLGSIPELGNNQPGKAVPLQTVDGIHWTLDADIQAPENGIVQYSYHIYRDGKDTRTEWNSLPRTLYVSADKKKVNPPARLLEESARTAILLHICFHGVPACTSRT